jgi:glycolate oxidase iron-sulfur subunit
MQTTFTSEQLQDPDIRLADSILRKCVHCGFCTATCPTYVLLGDENDGPRGRIYLIKEMLESEAPSTDAIGEHLDRCLTCLSCMSTCPSSVDYMHLVDVGRKKLEDIRKRPFLDRLTRWFLAWSMVRPRVFRMLMRAGGLARFAAPFLPDRFRVMLESVPASLPPMGRTDARIYPAVGTRLRRVALLQGCVQPALAGHINEATVRLLTRMGCEVVIVGGIGCCGALSHHMGREHDALAQIRTNVAAWRAEVGAGGLDALVINASGCGTTVKDYGHLLRLEPDWAADAAAMAAQTRDITEIVSELGLPKVDPAIARSIGRVAYHAACSLQHGQKVRTQPKDLLGQAGFDVAEPAESYLCCGSAGTYSLLQPALSAQLRERKADALSAAGATIVATGNIGCITQLQSTGRWPVLHTAELLDWATGGPVPSRMAGEAL